MQHRYLTRFATILQNKLHVFVACTSDCPLRGLKGLGLVGYKLSALSTIS